MKLKHTLSLLALMALSTSLQAQVSGFEVGYCNGQEGAFPSTEDSYFATLSTRKQAWTSCAIRVDGDHTRSLRGNEIRSVRAHLASKLNVDTLVVWVSTALDAPVLASDTITTHTKGWNDVELPHPVSITDDIQELYVGYSYHQKSTCKALSTLQGGTAGTTCFVRADQDAWQDYGNDYTACVEALVYGDNLPKYDLSLTALEVQPHYVVDDGRLAITATVRNNATVTITSFDAQCAISGIDAQYTAHLTDPIAYGEEKTYEFTIAPEAIQTMDPADRTLTLTLTNLAEGEDEVPSDNSLSAPFSVTLHSYERHVLLEEFTTEKCPNCPRVASFVHDALQEPEFQGYLHTMESHAGYYTDQFTTRFHSDWLWFYDSPYAPGVMFDRTADEGEITPVHSIPYKADLYGYIRMRMAEPAFVSLKITADVDEANQLINVRVRGSRAKTDITRNPARITVVLTETNLLAPVQAGASGDYYHINVGRRVNSTWGDELQWEGDDYDYTCSLPYTQDYDMSNLGVLAFIHDYDAEDKTRCEVANSSAITAAEFTGLTGVSSAAITATDTASQVYDLSGRRLQGLKHGVNIVRHNGQTTKVIM